MKQANYFVTAGFKRSLPLIDDNRNRFCPEDLGFELCAFMRQNEGGKQ